MRQPKEWGGNRVQWGVPRSGGGGAWTPTDEASLWAWYDFSDQATWTAGGPGALAGVADLGPNGFNLASDIGEPTTDGVINGTTCIQFSSDRMITTVTPPLVTKFTVGSMTAGTNVSASSGNRMVASWRTGSSDSAANSMRLNTYGPSGCYLNTNTQMISDSTPVPGLVSRATTSSFWRDGSQIGAYAVTSNSGPSTLNLITDPTGAWNVENLAVGASSAGSNFVNGNYGEIVIFLDYSLALRQRLEGYLAWKWGAEVELPLDHPYVSGPP